MKTFGTLLAAALLLTPLASSSAAGEASPVKSLEERLDEVLKKAFEKDRFVGLSVLVIDKDTGSFKKHYGFRDHARTLAPDDDTMYEIGSITKVFARLALAAQDKIKPDDLLADHLPEGIRVPKPHGQDITIKQVMTHTASFKYGVPCVVRKEDPQKAVCYGFDQTPGAKDPYNIGTKKLTYDYVSAFSQMVEDLPELIGKPGSYWQYSNTGIGLLGNMLGDAHSQSFEQFLYKTILSPLKMERSKIDMPCEKDGSCVNLVETHSMKKDGSGWEPWELWHLPGIAAAGGMRSSLADMEKFLRANMEPESSPIAAILKKGQSPLPEITASHNANICGEGQDSEKDLCNPSKKLFNYAWDDVPFEGIFSHGGATYGSESIIYFDSSEKVGAVLLANSGNYLANPTRHAAGILLVCIMQLRALPDNPMPPACKDLIEKSPIETN